MIAIMLVPLYSLAPYTADLLMYIGVNQTAATLTGNYMRTFLPGLFLNAIMDAVDIFLLACGKPHIIFYMQMSILPVHIIGDFFFIKIMNYGVSGAAMACNVTALISCICLVTYISRCPDFAEAWYRPSVQTFYGMGEYLALAIPGTIMMFVEALSL